jgi:hypothetical protein
MLGAAAAALYAVLTMPAWLYRYGGFLERSVSETFIVACVGLSAWCAVQFRERRSLLLAAGVGLFAGAAVVLKPNAGLYFPALLIWMAIYTRFSPGTAQPSLGRSVAVAGIAAAVVPVITIGWLWYMGILGEARIAVVDFNRFYVTQGFTVSGYALDFSRAVWLRMKTEPLWLAGGVGAIVALWELARAHRLTPPAGLAVIWGGASALVIVLNGARLYNSYFIQALAPLALLTTWLLGGLARTPLPRRLIAAATASLMVIVLVQRHYAGKVAESARADFDVLRGYTERDVYLERFGGYANNRGYSARANAELTEYVRTRSAPDDRIFLFGINGAGVYFAADRLTAHRFLRVNFFVASDFPDPRFRLEPVIEDLTARRPLYIIFERLHSASEMGKAADRLPDDPRVVRLLSAYRLEMRIEDFTLYRLVVPGMITATHQGRRGARPASREEEEYREYATDEERRGPGCVGGRMPP